jgi:hypothetical protein
MTGRRLVRLYPRAWRERYEDEFMALLDALPGTRRDRADLLRGALDAHLHPSERSLLPGLGAVLGGGLWILAAASIAALPAPPDWPGYLLDTVPLALVAVPLLAVSVVGAWLREDGRGGPSGRGLGRLGVVLAVTGHLAWAGSLVATLSGSLYGAPVALASTLAGVGTILIGLALARAGDWPIAGLLIIAPVLLILPPWLVPSSAAWLAFGCAWVGIGLVQLFGPSRSAGPLRLTD